MSLLINKNLMFLNSNNDHSCFSKKKKIIIIIIIMTIHQTKKYQSVLPLWNFHEITCNWKTKLPLMDNQLSSYGDSQKKKKKTIKSWHVFLLKKKKGNGIFQN